MKKIVLFFGLITGVVLALNMLNMVQMIYGGKDIKGNDFLGYTSLVVIFSLIFFGVRNYRDKRLNGSISFAKAFKTGALVALIGSTVYVIVWLFYYYLFVPDFIDAYTACVLRNCSASELPAKANQMAEFKEMYKNPLFVVLITYSEVLPVGLVVAFVSSLMLKKKSLNKQ